jgi:hypothetical protein
MSFLVIDLLERGITVSQVNATVFPRLFDLNVGTGYSELGNASA